jgi:hypothetical protein
MISHRDTEDKESTLDYTVHGKIIINLRLHFTEASQVRLWEYYPKCLGRILLGTKVVLHSQAMTLTIPNSLYSSAIFTK